MRLSQLSRSVAGRVVVITGAASGMGRANAHLFADEGAQVALLDIDAEALAGVVEEIQKAGGKARGWHLDLADGEATAPIVDAVAEAFGGIDILVNNAGISRPGPIDGTDYMAAWELSLAVMLTAHVRTVRAALPYLRKSSAPRIINIASTEALGATKYNSAYSAAKSGVTGLTRALAVELGSEAITVNCVCPGPVNTGMTAAIDENDKAVYARRRVALKRYAAPEEVAHAVLNFALPAATFMTGCVIAVDGGLTIKNA